MKLPVENKFSQSGSIALNCFYPGSEGRVLEESFGEFDIFHHNSPDSQLQSI
jgi:hypothetical protein